MKFLRESFGESEELNTFVYQLQRRFSTFYVTTLKLNGKISNKYFAYEEACKKYYDNLIKEANSNIEYYDGADISWDKVTINLDYDEQDSQFIDYDDSLNGDIDFNNFEESLDRKLGLKDYKVKVNKIKLKTI